MYSDQAHEVIYREQLSSDVFLFRVSAPLIARERRAGQFVLVLLDPDCGERIPLTIADADQEEGSITLVFQAIGATTMQLSRLKLGDTISTVVGPLGRPTHIENFGTAVCVGGGIGVAPLFPIVEALKNAGNRIITIIGARSKELLILEEKFLEFSDELIACTDDGTYGRKALVTEPLSEICERDPEPDFCVAIGPAIMMKFCSETTRPFDIPTTVSLNTIMIDGTGMCGGCRVTVGGSSKFVCVDGPEFDGHKVDFDEMMARAGAYRDQEKKDLHQQAGETDCKLNDLSAEKSREGS